MKGNVDIEIDSKKLKDLIEVIKDFPALRLGILGTKGPRSDAQGPSNAEIGKKHEFGEDGMPVRSFLRMPLIEKMSEYLESPESSRAFDEDLLKEVMESKDAEPWMKQVGATAELCVQDAFDTGGFGSWKKSRMEYKKNHQTLVETKQLRQSISSEVVKGKGSE